VQITQLLRRALQLNAYGSATVCEGRPRTWWELESRIARLAAAMTRLGYAPGDRIGILALNSDRYLEYYFAMAWGGFVFVPINTRLAPPEIAFWLTDSGCAGLFIDDTFLPALDRLKAELPGIRHIVHIGNGPAAAGLLAYEDLISDSDKIGDSGAGGDSLAGIFYTGGTTGRSKGVMLSHANIVANVINCAQEFGFTENTVWLHGAPMFHLADGGAGFSVTACGGKHVFLTRFDPSAFLASVAQERVTDTLCVPAMLNAVTHHPSLERHSTKTLGTIIYGAAPMPESVIRHAIKVMPHTKFLHGYGQTEASPGITFNSRENNVVEGPKAKRVKSTGRALIGCEVQIRGPDDRETPRGTVGEICCRGPNVMLGYWRQPEPTTHALRNGWLHTGDAGYMDEEGFVYIVDRLKDMIISGGENVYSAEVEQAIYLHADVAECAVIGVPDETWGERVHAIVRLKNDATVDADGLIAHCVTLIANFKCPRSIDFSAEPLPLSGAGKILKAELRKPFWKDKEKSVN
jgi:long-chain acyl-CoA synthetase